MRPVVCTLVFLSAASAQFKSTVPLVVAPTTVTDSGKGHYVDGLTAEDLILYDNNVPQAIQISWMPLPISLVVAVQTSANSLPVIDKLGRIGLLLTQLLAADAEETAMISFSDDVKVHQEFTDNPDLVTHSLRMLRTEGRNAHVLDAMREALLMLEPRPRRRIVLMIAEKRDRASESELSEIMERVQRLNATVYWLTYSPFLEPFTARAKTREDLKPEAERIKKPACPWCPGPDDRPAPYDPGPGGPFYALEELIRLRQPDLSDLFTKTTGGRTLSFLRKDSLEQAIRLVGAEVHRQYLLSFEPKEGEPGRFHTIRVAVKDRPELRIRTRAGYWTLQ